MSESVQRIRETRTTTDGGIVRDTSASRSSDDSVARTNIAERIVWLVAGIVLALLGFRFLLSLLGANPSNGIADFIYTTSQPLVTPFFSLFRYNNYVYGAARFEVFTLVAMVFYTLVAWGLSSLVSLNRD